jgi:hypothetical protein
MKIILAATAAVIPGITLPAHAVAAPPRPLVCQLRDLGLSTSAVMAAMAEQNGLPYPGSYGGTYWMTVSQSCPEYCNNVECG